MQKIRLLRELDNGNYFPVRTMAIPVSGSRVIKSDDGVEIEEGFQKFIIPKRKLDTSWKVQWGDVFFRVEGIVPSSTPYKLVLVCSVENRTIIINTCDNIIDYRSPEEIINICWGSESRGIGTEILHCEG